VSAQQNERHTPNDLDDQVILGDADWKERRKPDDQNNEKNDAKYPEPAPCPLIAGHPPTPMARIGHARIFHSNPSLDRLSSHHEGVTFRKIFNVSQAESGSRTSNI